MSFATFDQQVRLLAAERRGEEQLWRRFCTARRTAWAAEQLARALGRSTALLTLDALLERRTLRGGHSLGVQVVPIGAIVASEGRVGDFDCRFRPLRADSWDRWRSVARVLVRGDTLPPVELLAVGGQYAVRDGHHRISAAAALGQHEVDAVVTVLVG